MNLWRVEFDERRFAEEDSHDFSFGSMHKVTTRPIRWCSTHDAPALFAALTCPVFKLNMSAGRMVPGCLMVEAVVVMDKGEEE